MRKLLIYVIIASLVAIFALTAISGINIGNLHVASVREIVEDNRKIDAELVNLKQTTDKSYGEAKLNLDSSLATLQDTRERYKQVTSDNSEDELNEAHQSEEYDMGYLWTKIGLYATKNNVVIQLNVSYGEFDGYYNLSFLALGEYLPISEFIYAVEKDSTLGFRIDDFSMSQYNEDQLQASFVIRNVAINKDSLTAGGVLTQNNNNTSDTTSNSDETQSDTNNVDDDNTNTNANSDTNTGTVNSTGSTITTSEIE